MDEKNTKTPAAARISSENINEKEEKKMLGSTGDVVRGEESEVKKAAVEEKRIKNKEKNDEESLQDVKTEEPKELTEEDRLVLYEKGVRLKRKGNNRHALTCFLSCLQGLKEQDHFPVLPECLHNIAEIYSQEEEYEAAIQFAQAEKLYYETALITVDRDKAEPGAVDSHIGSMPAEVPGSSTTSNEAQKAEEYEKLAHMCLKQQNPQLALDYCAKAVKLQQSCYGEQHPVTLKTLDLFTVIYAEMGKQQYKAALEKLSATQEREKETKTSLESTNDKEAAISAEDERQGKANNNGDQTTSGDKMDDLSVEQSEEQEQSETTTEETAMTSQDTVKLTMTSSQALLIYFIITIILAIMLTIALCYITQTDPKTTYNYMITRLRFYYYYYFKRKGSNGHYF